MKWQKLLSSLLKKEGFDLNGEKLQMKDLVAAPTK